MIKINMDPAEVEFLAEKEQITIVPNFALDKIFLIGVRMHCNAISSVTFFSSI